MTAKIRELNLDDIKTVSGGVTMPTRQQLIANSANAHIAVSLPSDINAAMAMPKPPSPIR
jgi:hypothetical protein